MWRVYNWHLLQMGAGYSEGDITPPVVQPHATVPESYYSPRFPETWWESGHRALAWESLARQFGNSKEQKRRCRKEQTQACMSSSVHPGPAWIKKGRILTVNPWRRWQDAMDRANIVCICGCQLPLRSCGTLASSCCLFCHREQELDAAS